MKVRPRSLSRTKMLCTTNLRSPSFLNEQFDPAESMEFYTPKNANKQKRNNKIAYKMVVSNKLPAVSTYRLYGVFSIHCWLQQRLIAVHYLQIAKFGNLLPESSVETSLRFY